MRVHGVNICAHSNSSDLENAPKVDMHILKDVTYSIQYY